MLSRDGQTPLCFPPFCRVEMRIASRSKVFLEVCQSTVESPVMLNHRHTCTPNLPFLSIQFVFQVAPPDDAQGSSLRSVTLQFKHNSTLPIKAHTFVARLKSLENALSNRTPFKDSPTICTCCIPTSFIAVSSCPWMICCLFASVPNYVYPGVGGCCCHQR